MVPFEARSRYVGADYVEQLAELRGGTFARNPPDVGILAALDALDGPAFDASQVAPADPRVLRAHEPLQALDRARVADLDEARLRALQAGRGRAARPGHDPLQHRGGPARDGLARSTRSTFDGDEAIDIRGWIRTYADSRPPIYVGIYTSFRHEDRGYVSVGFPIPSSNFTATLRAAQRRRRRPAADLALQSSRSRATT